MGFVDGDSISSILSDDVKEKGQKLDQAAGQTKDPYVSYTVTGTGSPLTDPEGVKNNLYSYSLTGDISEKGKDSMTRREELVTKSVSQLMVERFAKGVPRGAFVKAVPQQDVDTKRKKDTPKSIINAINKKKNAIENDATTDKEKQWTNSKMRNPKNGLSGMDIGAERTRSNVYVIDDDTDPDAGTIHWEVSDIQPGLLKQQAMNGLRTAYNIGTPMDQKQSDIAGDANIQDFVYKKQAPAIEQITTESGSSSKYTPEQYDLLRQSAKKYGLDVPDESLDAWLDFLTDKENFDPINLMAGKGLQPRSTY